MSFDQLSSLEAGGGGAGGRRGNAPAGSGGFYSDDPEFAQLKQAIERSLYQLIGNNRRMVGEISHLGTRRDNPRVRERVRTLLEESRGLFKEVGERIKRLQTWTDVTPAQRYAQQKLSNEFQALLSEFQNLQRQALDKEKASVSAARAALDDAHHPGGPAGEHEQQQQQLQEQQELARLAPQDEVDFQDALIQEREDEIRNIEQGVGDLNVLFQQVAQIVSEQGEQLDNIANNVENVRDDTRGADRELRVAARHQRNARSKACCLLMILAVILTIVVLAVVLG